MTAKPPVLPGTLSVVVPCYREAETLPTLYERLVHALGPTGLGIEFVFVDDGSPDSTRDVLRRLRAADPRVRWIGLTRNFGHQAALTAGLAAARGSLVLTMDADLQHPPALVPVLIARAREGYDIVLTCRQDAPGTPPLKRLTSRGFYWIVSRFGDVTVEPGSSDFRLLSRRALDVLLAMPERHRFLRGMVVWTGFRTTTVAFQADARWAGTSGYSLRRMVRLAADALFSFSALPLRAAALLGVAIVGASSLYAIYALYAYFVLGVAVPGWTSLLLTVMFLAGVQIVTLGLVGEYVARVYDEVKGRPLYVVEERHGLDGDAD